MLMVMPPSIVPLMIISSLSAPHPLQVGRSQRRRDIQRQRHQQWIIAGSSNSYSGTNPSPSPSPLPPTPPAPPPPTFPTSTATSASATTSKTSGSPSSSSSASPSASPPSPSTSRDSDDDFLLIEAAFHLPRWLNPDTSLHRLFLRN
ncbi:hypothetical protein Fmac_002611 [Flemingia macrophylla]|uniref:Uncharacterized protein n=1 Tax=Flemingia macrophylla TaxID=520843 RepID=A0ABD1NKE9_9FABA